MQTLRRATSSRPAVLDAAGERRGAVLYAALFVLLPLAALTYGLMTRIVSFEGEKRGRLRDEQALHLAEAGIDESLVALRAGLTGTVGTAAQPAYLGGGMVWVEVEELGGSLIRLQSSAMYKSGRSTVETLVFRIYDSMYQTAIFSNQPLMAESNVFIDSFDSANGSYASQVVSGVAGEGAVIESNGDVGLDSTTEIHGDVHPGTEYSVSMASNATVSGVLQPLESTRTIETVVVPVIASAGSVEFVAPSTLPSGTYAFDDVKIDDDVVIEGPATIVMDSLELESNSSLTFDTSGGPVDVYVTGDTTLASNSTIITTEPSATLLTLYLLGTDVDLRSNSSFYGRIVAPNATVSVRSNFEVFGAILAETVELASNARLHYDRALLGLAGTPPIYRRATWARAHFPDDTLLATRRDPFVFLGLDPDLLNLPADAHDQP